MAEEGFETRYAGYVSFGKQQELVARFAPGVRRLDTGFELGEEINFVPDALEQVAADLVFMTGLRVADLHPAQRSFRKGP